MVIAIIGILIGLLIPAVQAAREAARRTQCRGHLSQMALALHHYHDSHRVFPPGYVTTAMGDAEPGWGWATLVLPYLEQRPLYDRLNPGPQILSTTVNTQLDLLRTPLLLYRCPSDEGESLGHADRQIFKNAALQMERVARSNYVAVCGSALTPLNAAGAGVFSRDSRTGIRDITDGTSNVVLVGERRSADHKAAVWCGVNTTSESVTGPLLNDFGPVFVLGSTGRTINATGADEDVQGFSSRHGGNAIFAFADGSTRLLSGSIDRQVYEQLGNRRDGKPLGGF